ncbi:unnamed protein product, partial [marine sediment metagenome]
MSKWRIKGVADKKYDVDRYIIGNEFRATCMTIGPDGKANAR